MRWITVATSDADIRGTNDAPGKSQVLTRGDLDVVCKEDSWLNDSIINYGVEECDAWGPPLGDLHNHVLWIRPAVVKAGKDGGPDTFDETLGQALGWPGGQAPKVPIDSAPALPSGATVVLFPVNQGDTHWSLLAFYKGVDSQHCRLVHYDSLNPANDAAANGLMVKLVARGFLSRQIQIENGGATRQVDGHNCGAFVIQYARLIMTLGQAPGQQAISAVTSKTSDDTRLAMQLALVPLIVQALPRPDDWWERPEDRVSTGVPVIPEQDKKTREEALKKVHEALQKENEAPLELSGMVPCKEQKPATLVVVLVSDDPETYDVEGGSVTFLVRGERFTRAVSFDGKRWMTSVKLRIAEPLGVAVSGKVHPAPEFEKEVMDHEEVEIAPGAEETITLTYTPKEPRRLHIKLLVEDEHENQDKDDEEKIRRAFPAGFKVDFVFDDGSEKRSATVKADGTVVDDIDKAAGARVFYRYRGVAPRFPDPKKTQYLAWEKDSPDLSPTVFLDKPKDKTKTQVVGYRLPSGTWGPVQREEDWELPKEHLDGQTLRRQLDVSNGKAPPGSADEPLTYVLLCEPPLLLMNGHLIEHVVCLMLENRGFDHFMGYLYEGSTKPKNSYPPPAEAKGRHAGLPLFQGLEGVSCDCAYDYDYTVTETHWGLTGRTKVKVEKNIRGTASLRRGARASNIPLTNPHEDFVHIFQDMYGALIKNPYDLEDEGTRDALVKASGEYKRPPMNGWAQNFCDGIRHHRGEETTILTNAMVNEIMEAYLPEQLPVMHGLARHYAVSDLWFCSVPSQTNTNRAFWCSGHAAGIVKNDFRPAIKVGYASDKMPEGNDGKKGIAFRRSLFDVLDEHGHDWKYYHSVPYPPALRDWSAKNYYYFESMFPQFKGSPHVGDIKGFYQAARSGALPKVTYIEPWWGGGKKWDAVSPMDRAVGNEFHPVADMFCGELFVKEVYDAIVSGPKADTTLFIITFDENGGTFDTFPPWKAVPPGREVGLPKGTEFGFKFDCYGVRVPTLLISKYIKPETVFRSNTEVPLDHTSIIATILKWLDVDKEEWKLGDRVYQAPTFEGVLQGDGDEEDARRKTAAGLLAFDPRRAAREKRATIRYGDKVRLVFVGNRWADPPHQKIDYLGGPTTSMNYWYPVATRDVERAIHFELGGDNGPVKLGDEVVIQATGKAPGGKSLAGYSLAVPEVIGAGTVYLYTGNKPSRWIPWLVHDRNPGVELKDGDEVFLFSERYLPKNLAQPFQGVELYDPYQRLTLDRYNDAAPEATRHARWRAGEWDIWRIELVG